MVETNRQAIRYQIQRRVAFAGSLSVALLAMVNLIVGYSVRKMPLMELLLHPSILVLLALLVVCVITSLKDWIGFRIMHVVFFLGYPLVIILVIEGSPYDMSFLAWSVYGIILCFQYRLLRKRLPQFIVVYIVIFLLLKLYESAQFPDFTTHAAIGVVILLSLFVYLFWVVFAEELRAYIRANDALQTERNKNLIFIKFGKDIAGVIHNMKSAMMSFTGYGELIDTQDPDSIARIIDLQKKASDHMLHMINNFMTAVKSYQRIETSIIHLNQLTEGSLEIFRGNQTLKKRVKIHIELGEPDIINAKPVEIMQIIDNLVKNAAESMHNTKRFDLYVRTGGVGERVFLQVEDQGTGMGFCASCGERDCMKCKEFAIGKSSKADGTGIGIVYVREIVKELGGELKFESMVDKGTKVTVYFPSGGR